MPPSLHHSATSRHGRSEEHTSELQSLTNLVCRLLLEKKNLSNTTRQGRSPKLLASRVKLRDRLSGLIEPKAAPAPRARRALLEFKRHAQADRANFGGRAGASDRPGHLPRVSGGGGDEREHLGSQRGGAVSGAQSDLLLRQRRAGRGVSGQRRFDAAYFGPAGGDAVPDLSRAAGPAH